MHHEAEGQGLIEAFFSALELRNLRQCEAVLEQLKSFSCQQPAYQPWCAYFSGILANERDRDWAEAERIFRRLLEKNSLELPMRGRVLLALGRTYDLQGRWAEAIDACESSLPVFAELGQPIEQAKARKQIAISYRRGFTRGDFGPTVLQQAIEHCQLALAVLEPIPYPKLAWLKGSVWNTLGLIHRSLGEWDDAISCYQHDLALCQAQDDRFGMGLTYGNLGEIYQKLGDWPQAQAAYQQALTIIREFDDRYQETESLANLGFLHQEMGETDLALDYYGQAVHIIEELRTSVSAEAARAGFFATIVDTYANAVLLCLEAGRQAQAFDYVERARSRAFLDVLAAGSLDLPRAMEARTVTLAEVQAALPADALLLEYFTTGLEEVRLGSSASQQGIQRHRFPQAKTLIFAITRDAMQVYDTCLSPNHLLPAQLESVVERHFLGSEMRQALYQRLIAPVEGLLQGKQRLYLLPHGPLHYIPFQALIAPDGETLLRRDGPQLIYAPSATLLFRYRRSESGGAPVPCLALGYNGQGTEKLRFAEEEARSIARLTGGDTLVGPSLKKETLYEQAGQYRLLHLSCHGDFNPQSPMASALHLAPDEALTALDVLEHLHLGCDLVTLSACESGLNRVRRGDELVGFLRAFTFAGAPALVSTLWCVDERSTRILMERFYHEIRDGVGIAEALKRAQLYLRDMTRQEAQDILVRFLADEILTAITPKGQSGTDLPAEEAACQQVGAYLKGLAAKGEGGEVESSPAQGNEEKIFADPYYWAPFILVGDHDV